MNTKELIIKIINPEWEHAQFVSISELKECEQKLEAANKRINRLEKAGDELLAALSNDSWEYIEWINESTDAVCKWNRAKEAKL